MSYSNNHLDDWVQCDKCSKWRKLPWHISAEEMPDVWYCEMNTWHPKRASCQAPAEDEQQGDSATTSTTLAQNNICGDTASGGSTTGEVVNKLSYRSLLPKDINGKIKVDRQISERTIAAHSLFASVRDDNDDDKNPPATAMYAKSSVFVSSSDNAHEEDEEERGDEQTFSILESLSHSHLWAELNGTTSTPGGCAKQHLPIYSFDMLPSKLQECMKDLALDSLASQTLTGEEVHAAIQDRDWENVPQGWTAVRDYCSVNTLVVALCQLVKEGVLECVQKNKKVSHIVDVGKNWDLAYRRAKMNW